MRLSIATTAIASQAMLINAFPETQWHSKNTIMLSKQTSSSSNTNLSKHRGFHSIRKHHREQPRFKKPRKQAPKECHPYSEDLGPIDYDIGILDACEPHEFCVESSSSALGGFCVDLDPRKLQEGYYDYSESFLDVANCDPDQYSYYECNCAEFDTELGTGSFSCSILEDYCFLDGICGSMTISTHITSTGTRMDYCYSFTTPFETEFCYKVKDDSSCNIAVGDEYCNSCDVVTVENENAGYNLYNCFAFDCTNTLAKMSGNDCTG